MKLKKITGKIHLLLGLLTGLVVFISMLAAALYVWEKELTEWYYHDYVYVPEVKKEPLMAGELWEKASAALPEKDLPYLTVYNDDSKCYVFSNYKESDQPGIFWMSDMEWMDRVYVDQYSGKILGVVDQRYDWIFMTRMLHQCLLLRYDIGHLIVAIATLIIFVMAATGLILWWPRNKAAIKQRFSIKWNTRWRRVNYDIHNVGGFYTNLLILFLAATGLVWSFDWWTNGIYRLLGDDPDKVFAPHSPPVLTGDAAENALDIAFADALNRRPDWSAIYFDKPQEGGFSAWVEYDGKSGWQESDSYIYHPETGKFHWQKTHEQKLLGEKWRNSNYAIHVGSIYGLPTKILASFVALICAFLPLTGFLIWWGRRKKPANRRKAIKIRSLPREVFSE